MSQLRQLPGPSAGSGGPAGLVTEAAPRRTARLPWIVLVLVAVIVVAIVVLGSGDDGPSTTFAGMVESQIVLTDDMLESCPLAPEQVDDITPPEHQARYRDACGE